MPAPKDLVRGSVVPVVLSLLAEQPMYGYEMVRLVNARTNGVLEWKEGTLYPTLHGLEAGGLIKSEWRDVKTASGDVGERQRKYYVLTRAGRAELKKRSAEWRAFADAVGGLLKTHAL
ncbi:MAG TPA: PadR family transcriptional regulator [Tepidisphaeraceae bacterium]|jgi:DNA-binding PadR family transcriptional regulator